MIELIASREIFFDKGFLRRPHAASDVALSVSEVKLLLICSNSCRPNCLTRHNKRRTIKADDGDDISSAKIFSVCFRSKLSSEMRKSRRGMEDRICHLMEGSL